MQTKETDMDKKKLTVIITSVCVVMALVLTVAYMLKQGIIDTDNLFTASGEGVPVGAESGKALPSVPGKDGQSAGERTYSEVLLTEGGEYTLPWVDELHEGKEVSTADIALISTEISKKDKDFFINGDEGRQGNSYVFVKIKIVNRGERELKTTLNRFYLIVGPENGYELRGYDNDKPHEMTPDYYHTNFKPGEEKEFTLVYVVEDEILEKNSGELFLYASLMDGGSSGWDKPLPVIGKEG